MQLKPHRRIIKDDVGLLENVFVALFVTGVFSIYAYTLVVNAWAAIEFYPQVMPTAANLLSVVLMVVLPIALYLVIQLNDGGNSL